VRFCIDAGHGGTDPGAIGPSGLRECDVVLNIAMFVRDCLAVAGHAVHMTRDSDYFLPLAERCEIANVNGVDRFVSIHANAFSNPQARGFEVWTSPGWTPADPIATAVFDTVRQTFPDLPGRVDTSDGDVDKESRFYVLVHTDMPAILVETGFISNPTEENWLRNVPWQMRMAGAICGGITRV
jgi:N-acetylmuramoyl-L-alanine amidase